MALRIMRDREKAADAAQDTFLRAYVFPYIRKPAFGLAFAAALLVMASFLFRGGPEGGDNGGKAPPYEMSPRAAADQPELGLRVPGVPEKMETVWAKKIGGIPQ